MYQISKLVIELLVILQQFLCGKKATLGSISSNLDCQISCFVHLTLPVAKFYPKYLKLIYGIYSSLATLHKCIKLHFSQIKTLI